MNAVPSIDIAVHVAGAVLRAARRKETLAAIGKRLGYRDHAAVWRFLNGKYAGNPEGFVLRVQRGYPAEYEAALSNAEKPKVKREPPKGSVHHHLRNAEKSIRLARAALRIRHHAPACDHRSRKQRK